MYFRPGSRTDLGPVARSNRFEDFLLELNKKFVTTGLTRKYPFRVRGEVSDYRMMGGLGVRADSRGGDHGDTR
jgi:hypothetical protein